MCAFGRVARPHHRTEPPPRVFSGCAIRARLRVGVTMWLRRRRPRVLLMQVRVRILSAGPHLDSFPAQNRHQFRDGWVQPRSPADGPGMAKPVPADQGDQVDVAERAGPDEQRRRDVDSFVAQTPDQRGRRILTLGQCCRCVPARFGRNKLEERQGQVFKLGDLAARRPRQRTESRNRGAKQAFGFEGFALDRDLPEIGRRHWETTPDATRYRTAKDFAENQAASRTSRTRSN